MSTMNPYTLMQLNKIHINEMLQDAQRRSGSAPLSAQDARSGRTMARRARYVAVAVSAAIVTVVGWFVAGSLGLLPAG